jgi:sigma-B regulation protein RsbU (phosphoserine phosphatase)
MSISAPSPAVDSRGRKRGRLGRFWQKISEGRQLDELWSQFRADAQASYGFYIKDTDEEELGRHRGPRRWYKTSKALFWALVMRLTPARRVLLLLALLLLVLSAMSFKVTDGVVFDVKFEFAAILMLLLLLSLELADKVTMKRDLEIAREIQLWLVPSEAPVVAGADIAFATRPQNSVAGDYYDAFYPDPENKEKLLLVIADVAGKSVPAALLMATLQASLRTIAGEGVSLGELVTRLNRYASAYSLGGMRFTTAVLGLYEPSSRRLTYVNAGHNAPILRRRNGDLMHLDVGGLPLGIESTATYETASVELEPGDALILFTDGVVEAFNDRGEEYGNPRWEEGVRALPDWRAQETLAYLMKRVDVFVGATRQSDDITCLVFRST